MPQRKPNMPVGLAILKVEESGDYTLTSFKPYSVYRQIEYTVELDEGDYVIVPLTAGTNLGWV